MSRSLPDVAPPAEITGPAEILVGILRELGDLPRLMEFYYLWREPGLAEILRSLSTAAPHDLEQLAHLLRNVPQDGVLRIDFPDVNSAIIRSS
jgi:hypothetical protein